MSDFEERPPPEPRWGIHVAILGTMVLVAIGVVASLESKSRPAPRSGLDALVGFGDAMEMLGLIAGIVSITGFYILASTFLALLLRRRHGALWWAHGGSVLAVILYASASRYSAARHREEVELQERQRVEVKAAEERAREAADAKAGRECVRGAIRGERSLESPIARGRPTKPVSYRVQLYLELRCELRHGIEPDIAGFRLKGKGAGWELAPVEVHYTPPRWIMALGDISVGGISHGEYDVIEMEAGDFTLEVLFPESSEWGVRPIESVHIGDTGPF